MTKAGRKTGISASKMHRYIKQYHDSGARMFTEAFLRSFKGQLDVEQKASRMKLESDQTLEQVYYRMMKERMQLLREQ